MAKNIQLKDNKSKEELYPITTTAAVIDADSGKSVKVLLSEKVDKTSIGTPGGLATLNGAGLIPAYQLPSFVDDVLSYTNLAAMPRPGEDNKIYIALDTNRQYRWAGASDYAEISKSIALGETSSTAYPGDKGKKATDDIVAINSKFNNYSTTTQNDGKYAAKSVETSKLNASSYTAADVLAKIKTVDGAGSGLDADTLDGVHGSGYVLANPSIAADTKPTRDVGYGYAENGWKRNGPAMSFGIGEYVRQIQGDAANDDLYVRRITGTNVGSWRTLAYTDSNVASATKLQTPRTINGIAFDGTANITITTGAIENKALDLSLYVDGDILSVVDYNKLVKAYADKVTTGIIDTNIFPISIISDDSDIMINLIISSSESGNDGYLIFQNFTYIISKNDRRISFLIKSLSFLVDGSGEKSLMDDGTYRKVFNTEILTTSTTLTNLSIDNYSIKVTLSATSALSFSRIPKEGWEGMIDILNSSASDIIQPLPNSGNYQSDTNSVTLKAGKITPISVRFIHNKYIIKT